MDVLQKRDVRFAAKYWAYVGVIKEEDDPTVDSSSLFFGVLETRPPAVSFSSFFLFLITLDI
jgi:hypothetical protein